MLASSEGKSSSKKKCATQPQQSKSPQKELVAIAVSPAKKHYNVGGLPAADKIIGIPRPRTSCNIPSRMMRLQQRIGEVFATAPVGCPSSHPITLKQVLRIQPIISPADLQQHLDNPQIFTSEGDPAISRRRLITMRQKLGNSQWTSTVELKQLRESADLPTLQRHRLLSTSSPSVIRVAMPLMEKALDLTAKDQTSLLMQSNNLRRNVAEHKEEPAKSQAVHNHHHNSAETQPSNQLQLLKIHNCEDLRVQSRLYTNPPSNDRRKHKQTSLHSQSSPSFDAQQWRWNMQIPEIRSRQSNPSSCNSCHVSSSFSASRQKSASRSPTRGGGDIDDLKSTFSRQVTDIHYSHPASGSSFNGGVDTNNTNSSSLQAKKELMGKISELIKRHEQNNTSCHNANQQTPPPPPMQEATAFERRVHKFIGIQRSSSSNSISRPQLRPPSTSSAAQQQKLQRVISVSSMQQQQYSTEGKTTREQSLIATEKRKRLNYPSIDQISSRITRSDRAIPRVIFTSEGPRGTGGSSMKLRTEHTVYEREAVIIPQDLVVVETTQTSLYLHKLCAELESELSSDEYIVKEIAKHGLTTEGLAFYLRSYLNSIASNNSCFNTQINSSFCVFKISDGLFRRVRVMMERKLAMLSVPESIVLSIEGFISELAEQFVSRNLFIQLGSESMVRQLLKHVISYINERTSVQVLQAASSDERVLALTAGFFCEVFKQECVGKFLQHYHDAESLQKLNVTATEFTLVKMLAHEAMKGRREQLTREDAMRVIETLEVIRRHLYPSIHYETLKLYSMANSKFITDLIADGYGEAMAKKLKSRGDGNVGGGSQSIVENLRGFVKDELQYLLNQVDVISMARSVEKYLSRKEDFSSFTSQLIKRLKAQWTVRLRPHELLNIEVNAMKTLIYMGVTKKNFGLFHDVQDVKESLQEEIEKVFQTRIIEATAGRQGAGEEEEEIVSLRAVETKLLERAVNVNFLCYAVEMIFNEFAVFHSEETDVAKKFFEIDDQIIAVQISAFRNLLQHKAAAKGYEKQAKLFEYFLQKSLLDTHTK